MKRRNFIKTTAVTSFGLSITSRSAFNSIRLDNTPSLLDSFTLKGFESEREESPLVVSNAKGEMWLFSLRRLDFPQDEEIISMFKYDGKTWIEGNAVTNVPGQFENPVAACAKNGEPVVAWVEINKGKWQINVSQMQSNRFVKPDSFKTESGNLTKPVIISPDENRIWLAWEKFCKGKFTVHISKFENKKWSEPISIDKIDKSCFDPALAEDKNGNLYVVYGYTEGFHQNIELTIIDGQTLNIQKKIAVAVGGARKNRVNINSNPTLAFDANNNLWISYESNRNASRMEDGDNYTGDRCCAIVSYQNGKVQEIDGLGKWLFTGINDHRPTFLKDNNNHLYLATHCGGDFVSNSWKYRLSWLDPFTGWQKPVQILDTKIKGLLLTPAIAFDKNNRIWLATINDQTFVNYDKQKDENVVNARLTQLNLHCFNATQFSNKQKQLTFKDTQITEYRPDENSIGTFSGRPKFERKQIKVGDQTYTLLYGNLHEHSNSSNCWPAGCDGTLHEDYRFGLYSESYDFVGITDHAGSTSESHWRRNLRTADFYNESEHFVAIPAIEWTLQSDPDLDHIQHGAGHYNIIFASTEDARKYIRNKYEIYCPHTPETKIAPMLWDMLDEKQINCVTIPHHPGDKVHPLDWEVTNPKYVTAAEIFQYRGNYEYRGCPRERNISRHIPSLYPHTFVNYPLHSKKYKMGFIASGDHNNMGIGLAALWVKEVSREGIIEALKSRRTFATTGDKMFIDFRIEKTFMGETSTSKNTIMNFKVIGQYPIDKVDILRNSQVIESYYMQNNELMFEHSFTDPDNNDNEEVLYYYVRVTQKNNALGWSSPIWVEEV